MKTALENPVDALRRSKLKPLNNLFYAKTQFTNLVFDWTFNLHRHCVLRPNKGQAIVDLKGLVDRKEIEVVNRGMSPIQDNSRVGIHLDEKEGDGVAWLKNIMFLMAHLSLTLRKGCPRTKFCRTCISWIK